MLSEIKSFLITDTGRHISKRYSESAFRRYGHNDLITFINENTSHWPEEAEFSLRCWAIVRGCTILNICPTCNKEIISKSEHGWNVYCDKTCQYNDPSLSDKIKIRRKSVDHEKANSKRKETMKSRFGVEYASQRQSHKEALSSKAHTARKNKFPLLNDSVWLHEQHVINKRKITDIADEIGVYYGTVQEALDRLNIPYKANCSGYNISRTENELFEYVKNICPDAIQGDRKLIGKELDILIPSKNLAIEFNGLFWHSIGYPETIRSPSYHRDKMIICNEKGLRLIHVNENEWRDDKEKIKSIILNALNKTTVRIGARTLNVIELDISTRKKFFNENHLKGDANASFAYGLEKNGIVYAAISISKPRFSKEVEWEIIRYATLLNHSVQGGFSRLLKHFRKAHRGDIISYCDLMKGTGNLYRETGFVYVRTTSPGYYWTDKTHMYSRTQFMKKNLHKVLERVDNELSESVNMMANGYRKFYDCGNSVWILRDQTNV